MMKHLSFTIFVAFFAVLAISCSKENGSHEPENESFELNGVAYSTLQQAVDAAESSSDAVITLTKDSKGRGAVVSPESVLGITIDFQSFTYTLESGSSIKAEENFLCLTANGGGLRASDDTPVLMASDSAEVELTGQLSIVAGKAIEAEEALVYTYDFTGKIEGDIALDASTFYLSDTSCSIDSDILEVTGEKAAFMAETGTTPASGYAVRIGKVVSALEYPVMSDVEGVIRVDNGSVHIHKMESKTVPGTCMSTSYIEKTCSECGYKTYQVLESMGSCPADKLVHYPAKAATDFECGNIEYWECPLCGTRYSTPDGKTLLTENPLILADSYLLGLEILSSSSAADSKMGTKADPMAVIGFINGCISCANGLHGTIFSLATKSNSEWLNAYNQLKDIKNDVDKINTKLKGLDRAIKNIPVLQIVSTRHSKLEWMRKETFDSDSIISSILKDSKLDQKQKEDSVIKEIKYWAECKHDGVMNFQITKELMSQYRSGYVGKKVPILWGDYVNRFFAWEHEGYNLRREMQMHDIAVMCKAWCMTFLYYSSIKKYDKPEDMTPDTTELRSMWNNYCADWKESDSNMESRNNKYRRLNSHSVTFSREEARREFHDWFDSKANRDKYLFPRDNSYNRAVTSWEAYLDQHDLKDKSYITLEQAQFIYNYHRKKGEDGTIQQILYNLGFSVTFGNNIFTQDNSGFRHENGDPAHPQYKMFSWESWKNILGGDDCIKIHTVLCSDATQRVEYIRKLCWIRTWGERIGWITKPGNAVSEIYFTILVVNE